VSVRLRAALFDFGDTLFYSPDGGEVIAAEAGIGRPEADRLWSQIWTRSKTPEALAVGRDRSAALHRQAWLNLFKPADRYRPGLSELLYERVMDHQRWRPYPDTAPVLRALKRRRVRVGVVSNIPQDLAEVFESHRLGGLVDAFVHSFELGLEKPDPRLFQAACRRLRVAPRRALMVGDNQLSDGGAVEAGLEVLLLPPVPPGGRRGLDRVLRFF